MLVALVMFGLAVVMILLFNLDYTFNHKQRNQTKYQQSSELESTTMAIGNRAICFRYDVIPPLRYHRSESIRTALHQRASIQVVIQGGNNTLKKNKNTLPKLHIQQREHKD